MNPQQLKAILHLRWQLTRNQWRKAGIVNVIVGVMFIASALFSSVAAFFVAIFGGRIWLESATPDHILYVWDAVAVGFLLFWGVGLLLELQRSELLSLDRFLHLPVSLTGAFVLNYLSSLASLVVVVFVPAMIGLSLAMLITHGAVMLLMFPLVFGFLFFVTSITYQLRGWLARLMENKRRRRSVMAAMTISIIVIAQLPNLVNIMYMGRHRQQRQAASAEQQTADAMLDQELQDGKIDAAEFERRWHARREQSAAERTAASAAKFEYATEIAMTVNKVVPFGWLPYGARSAATGNPLPTCWGIAGFLTLGFISIRSSYRSTIRSYVGHEKRSRADTPAIVHAADDAQARIDSPRTLFLERRLPFASEAVSAIALTALRSMLRAPESKMALLTPLIFTGVFGSIILSQSGSQIPAEARPFLAIGSLGFTLFGTAQFMINLFGTDRAGFRAFVLMPVERGAILVGRNASIGILSLVLFGFLLAVFQVFLPLSPSHLLATLLQSVPAFLLASLAGNLVSILMPLAMAMGTVRPDKPKFVNMLVQGIVMMLFPLLLLPAALACLVELGLNKYYHITGIPIYLILSAIMAPLAGWMYLAAIRWQGRLFQRRETRILEVVSATSD